MVISSASNGRTARPSQSNSRKPRRTPAGGNISDPSAYRWRGSRPEVLASSELRSASLDHAGRRHLAGHHPSRQYDLACALQRGRPRPRVAPSQWPAATHVKRGLTTASAPAERASSRPRPATAPAVCRRQLNRRLRAQRRCHRWAYQR